MSNNKQSSLGNPFLQDAESTHEYNNQMFVIDYYPHPHGGTWQCCDANHYFRTRAKTKDEAIRECHKKWDEYLKKNKTMSNNKQTIKLYTEEDIINAALYGRWGGTTEKDYIDFMNSLTPIELPSDEEIENLDTFLISDVDSFIRGAKWMRDKIQGGNK